MFLSMFLCCASPCHDDIILLFIFCPAAVSLSSAESGQCLILALKKQLLLSFLLILSSPTVNIVCCGSSYWLFIPSFLYLCFHWIIQSKCWDEEEEMEILLQKCQRITLSRSSSFGSITASRHWGTESEQWLWCLWGPVGENFSKTHQLIQVFHITAVLFIPVFHGAIAGEPIQWCFLTKTSSF